MQVSQDELSHSRVQLPDAGGHDSDRKSRFVVGSHLLLSLFLQGFKRFGVDLRHILTDTNYCKYDCV